MARLCLCRRWLSALAFSLAVLVPAVSAAGPAFTGLTTPATAETVSTNPAGMALLDSAGLFVSVIGIQTSNTSTIMSESGVSTTEGSTTHQDPDKCGFIAVVIGASLLVALVQRSRS